MNFDIKAAEHIVAKVQKIKKKRKKRSDYYRFSFFSHNVFDYIDTWHYIPLKPLAAFPHN